MNPYLVVGLSHDLKRSFELLEVLLPAYFYSASSIFRQKINLNRNDHEPLKNDTLNVLMKMPTFQAEIEFYNFVLQKFEVMYEMFVQTKSNSSYRIENL